MYETVKTVGNIEYFYDDDKRLVMRYADESINYRSGELLPEVADLLNEARLRFRYPSKALINTVIKFQAETPAKAINYIKYRLLGTAGYLDVFGPVVEEQKNSKKIEDIEQEIAGIKDLCLQILQKM